MSFAALGGVAQALQVNTALSAGDLEDVNGADKSSFEGHPLVGCQETIGTLSSPNNVALDWLFSGNCGVSCRNAGVGDPSQASGVPGDDDAAFIEDAGTISTSVTVDPLTVWRLRFNAAQRVQVPASKEKLRIRLDGSLVAEFEPSSDQFEEYVTRPVDFPQGGVLTISLEGFTSSGSDAVLIDHVRLEPIGRWNDGGTWQLGVKPGPGHNVNIPMGVEVALTGAIQRSLNTEVEGELLVPVQGSNASVDLRTRSLQVRRSLMAGAGERSGRFEVGQEGALYTGDFKLTLRGNRLDQSTLPPFGQKVLIAQRGGQIEMHGIEKTAWTKLTYLSTDRKAIRVDGATGWDVGDRIVVTGTHAQWAGPSSNHPCDPLDPDQSEERIITAIAGSTYLLDEALIHPHAHGMSAISIHDNCTMLRDCTDPDVNKTTWTLDQRAEVGLLSRNITIRGDAASNSPIDGEKFGGHMMITQAGEYDLYDEGIRSSLRASNVEFLRMGQQGILGRYPIHWHLMLDIPEGQYVRNCSVHSSFSRAVVVHSTDSILVEDNVVYGAVGHAMFLEDGTEEHNTFRRNLVVNTIRPALGNELIPTDNSECEVQNRSPAAFWITNPNNKFEGNVVAGNPGTAFWYIFPKDGGVLVSENEKNIHEDVRDYANSRNPSLTPLMPGGFEGNVAHGCGSGFDINDAISLADETHVNNTIWRHGDLNGAVFQSFTSYGCYDGIYTGPGSLSEPLYFDNAILADNREGVRIGRGTTIRKSLFVQNSKNTNFPRDDDYRSGFVYYDGYGNLETCHFVGYPVGPLSDAPYESAAAIFVDGGQVVHAHNTMHDISYPYSTLDDQIYIRRREPLSRTYATVGSGATQGPMDEVRRWGGTIRFADGTPWPTMSGPVPCTLTSSHPLVKSGPELAPLRTMPEWNSQAGTYSNSGARLTTDRYGHLRLFKGAYNRKIDVKRMPHAPRQDPGTDYYEFSLGPNTTQPHRMFPVILEDLFLEDVFTYSVRMNSANTDWPTRTRLYLSDSEAGDAVIVALEGCSAYYNDPQNNFNYEVRQYFGDTHVTLSSMGMTPPSTGNLPAQTCYYDDGTDIWIVFVGSGFALDPVRGHIELEVRRI